MLARQPLPCPKKKTKTTTKHLMSYFLAFSLAEFRVTII
jgi:hypothetical protein